MALFVPIIGRVWGSTENFTDFVVETDVRNLSSNLSSQYGIFFRQNDNGDYYIFTISDGSYEIARQQNKQWSILKPLTKSAYIKTAGETNHLKVAVLGDLIEVSVNGQKLHTLQDNSLSAGKIGFYIEGQNALAAFDNFKIYTFTDAYLVQSGRIVSKSIPPSGGTIVVDKPGDPLNGLQITVPGGAFSAEQTFTISSTAAPAFNFQDVTVLSPLITINNKGNTSNLPVTLKIPVKIPTTNFALAFYYDNGKLEGVPLLEEDAGSITVSTKRFEPLVVLSITKQTLLDKETQDIRSGLLTGFQPGVDDWQIPNKGSFISPGGNCAGMSLTALAYFLDVVKTNKNAPHLNGLYSGRITDKQFWEDDVQAYQLVSTVQRDYINTHLRKDEDEYEISSGLAHMHDELVFNAFGFAMLITGEPQLIGVSMPYEGRRAEHSMIAYGIYQGGILVADPNDQKGHVISFDGSTLTTFAGSSWDMFFYDAKSSLVAWDKVQGRWAELNRGGQIGTDVFPAYNINLVDATGKKTDLKNYGLNNPVNVNTRNVTISLTSSNTSLQLAIWNDRDKEWMVWGMLQKDWLNLELKSGSNVFGLLVESDALITTIVETKDNPKALWDDFKWITINCTAPDTETWTVSLTGTSKTTSGAATFEHNYSINITVPGSLAAAARNTGYVSGTGIASGGSTVVSQTATDTRVNSGSITSLNVTVSAPHYGGEIWIFSVNEAPIVLYSYTYRGTTYQANGFKGFVLIPRNITDTTITGDWRTADISGYTLGGLSGTFIISKQ